MRDERRFFFFCSFFFCYLSLFLSLARSLLLFLSLDRNRNAGKQRREVNPPSLSSPFKEKKKTAQALLKRPRWKE